MNIFSCYAGPGNCEHQFMFYLIYSLTIIKRIPAYCPLERKQWRCTNLSDHSRKKQLLVIVSDGSVWRPKCHNNTHCSEQCSATWCTKVRYAWGGACKQQGHLSFEEKVITLFVQTMQHKKLFILCCTFC